MIQNAAARLVFNEPKRAHVTPLFVSLHWLPVAARIQFKTLMLAYRTTTGSAPTNFHSLLRIYIPSRSLRSASEAEIGNWIDSSMASRGIVHIIYKPLVIRHYANIPTEDFFCTFVLSLE